jgi:hypothetical protein
MVRSITLRLARLEESNPNSDIPVWCEDESEVEATITEMVKRKEIAANDRGRCVYWGRALAPVGSHERALGECA